jgi:hypothetical protein
MTSEQLAAIAAGIPGARITSGQRDPAHNAAVGGVPNSQHIAGTALDFVAPGVSLEDVRAKFPGEQVLYHDAGSGLHYHVQGTSGATPPTATPPAPPAAPAPQPEAHDPYLATLDSATEGSAQSGQSNTNPSGGSPGYSVGGAGDTQQGYGAGSPDGGQGSAKTWGDTLKSVGSGLASLTPATDAYFNGRSYLGSLNDDISGIFRGAAKIPETAIHVEGNIASYLGAKHAGQKLHDIADHIDQRLAGFASDPNSTGHRFYQVGGEIGATLPLTEFALAADAARAAKAGKLVTGLARYGDLAAQGGVIGAATSGGHDILKSAAEGAVLAPALGAAGDVIIPKVIKAGAAVSDQAKAVAAKLRGVGAAEEAPAVEQTIRRGIQPAGWTADEAAQGWRRDTSGKIESLPGVPKYGAKIEVAHGGTPFPVDPGKGPTPIVPKSTTPGEMRQAMGSRGSNSGLEAHPDLAPDVAAHVDRLRMQGVPLDQAVREAEVTAVGGKPTIATTTRNPEDQAAVWEGAKQATPEGRALSAQIAQNNAAVVNRVQGMVQDAGGVPAQGEAAETAATSLAKASDAEKAKVSALYKAADEEAAQSTATTDARDAVSTNAHQNIADSLRANYEAEKAAVEEANAAKRARMYQGGGAPPINELPRPEKPVIPDAPAIKKGGYIDVSGFRRALDNPEMANPTIEGVKSLRSGVLGQLEAYAGETNKITLEQAEKLRQSINDAYDPMGSGINGHVGRLKASLDNALDSTEAGPAYKAARAAHKAWAEKYDNPDGISALIKRDAQGNFVNGDNWRKAENFIGSTGDKPFIQVVTQLKANGDTAALNRLKASVLQRAYERATNNATDKLGNATLNGKLFFGELNKIGAAKLKALFSPAELSDLATTGRAAIHLNEAVPGTNNTSNTSSALAKALLQPSDKGGKGRLAARLTAHGLAAVKAPIVGNIATEAVDRGVTALGKRSQAKELARALTESMDPAKARQIQAAKAARMADALKRKTTARSITKRSPLAAALLQGHR